MKPNLFRSFTYGAIIALCNVTIASAEPVTIAALGDSLTAGYGLPPEQGLVPQLQAWLTENGQDVVLVNAGVSGDTTAGGLSRLDWTLTADIDAVIVTLGGNDMLRGIAPAESRKNMDAILAALQARAIPALVLPMQAPTNFGPDYKAQFDALYAETTAAHGATLGPAFFQGLAGDNPDPAAIQPYLQADGIHPNAEGVAKIVAVLGPAVAALAQAAQK